MSDQQCLYVGTAGEYSDYRVVGVFSSYENARKNSEVESIFVTTLDEPHKEVGAWKCVMCEAPTTAYFSAPAGKYPKDRLFQPGDIIDTSFEIGVPVEEGPRTAYSKTIQAYGHSEEAAIRAAREYLSVRSTLPWVANAWWPRQQYRTAPIEPLVETAWAHLAPQEGAVQAYGATEEEARRNAVKRAGVARYTGGVSSETTVGLLKVWTFAGIVSHGRRER